MGKKIDLSVIIPVYQSEQYIAECLQSILCQKNINIEVLCMDDGSTDQSSHIIQNIAKSEKRVQWIPLEHQGVSHTRNEGLKRAKGEYVFFLDADDKVDGKTLAKALQKAQKHQVSVYVFGAKTSDPYHTPFWIQKAFSTCNKRYEKFEPEIFIRERGIRPSASNKLYKRELLIKNRIFFYEDLQIAEDHALQFLAFPYAKKIWISSQRIYYYRIHQESSAVSCSLKDDTFRTQQHFFAMEYVKKEWIQRGIWNKEEYAETFFLCCLDFLFDAIFELPTTEDSIFYAKRLFELINGQKLCERQIGKQYQKQIDLLRQIVQNGDGEKKAEQILSEYKNGEEKKGLSYIVYKVTAPARYIKWIGWRSTWEHYIGKVIKRR